MIDPERYGFGAFDEKGKVTSIEEKLSKPKSTCAVPRLSFFDDPMIDVAARLQASSEEELEITDVNKVCLAQGELNVETLGRGVAQIRYGNWGKSVAGFFHY